jgi:hypothetical protein
MDLEANSKEALAAIILEEAEEEACPLMTTDFTAASLVEVVPILPPTMAVDPDSTT